MAGHRKLSDVLVAHVKEHAQVVAPLVRARARAGAERVDRWKLAINASVEPDRFADELRAAHAEPGERIVDVLHGEHDAWVAERVHRVIPVIGDRLRDQRADGAQARYVPDEVRLLREARSPKSW